MKVKFIIICFAISLGINIGVAATFIYYWQQGKRLEQMAPFKHDWEHSSLRHKLDLNRDQMEAMKLAREEMDSKTFALRQDLGNKRMELMRLLREETEPDESKLKTIFKEIADLQAEIELCMFKNIRKIKQILEPAQEEQLFKVFYRTLRDKEIPEFPQWHRGKRGQGYKPPERR